ncbi:iron ABC transporter permease [Bacillus sp. HMF5848]|uniref:FecCD family ABC transporter permease n=1 Tax=Bacillus sp. HMF5848 TaxID=2495421 RepID=UPI000F79EF90|nr:iron ABC transporter permease [Bacillus sp. HMF5848]RSK28477.1 iron ABC transporter permease [Bacillus sp. HMF5848]
MNAKAWRFRNIVSFMVYKRAAWILLLTFIIAAIIVILNVGMGDMFIPPAHVIDVLLGGGTKMEALVVKSFRLPRILMALLAGACLGMAGAILQGIIRNPLASPDIIGLSKGAAVGVVAFLTLFSNENNALTVSIVWLPLAAFIGAVIAAFLVYILAWSKGVSPIRLVLVGIGISALMHAFVTMFLILAPIYRAGQANIWITGTIHGTNWDEVSIITPIMIVLTILSIAAARSINIQELGDDIATSVGSRVQQTRLWLLILSTALTGVAVAFVGAIGFVGLVAPHISRRLVGGAFGALLPMSALVGGIIVMLADLIGRTMFSPLEVPAGVFTAAIGAPYFIYLLFKGRHA